MPGCVSCGYSHLVTGAKQGQPAAAPEMVKPNTA
jgi:hypothetical protein